MFPNWRQTMIYLAFVCPECILTDQTQASIGALAVLYELHKSCSDAHHQQRNGACERFTQTVESANFFGRDGACLLPALLQDFNKGGAKMTQHYVVFGSMTGSL